MADITRKGTATRNAAPDFSRIVKQAGRNRRFVERSLWLADMLATHIYPAIRPISDGACPLIVRTPAVMAAEIVRDHGGRPLPATQGLAAHVSPSR
ncbi:MAG TPA: hypothetical protein VII22_26520 [Streptosporangiaceae bacterium]|jgi:hypothetical protein